MYVEKQGCHLAVLEQAQDAIKVVSLVSLSQRGVAPGDPRRGGGVGD